MKILIAGTAEKTENYQDALRELGANFVCSLTLDEIDTFDGLLLPGGADVDPSFFGAENEGSEGIDMALDMAQFAILSEFVNMGKPVLGICRGHQLINIYFGGSLIQDLGEAGNTIHRWTEETGDKVHQTTATPGSFIAQLYGEAPFATNSAHHQAINALGRDLIAVQSSADGVNEAIVHASLPIYGVQWHPERMCFAKARPDTVDGSKVINLLLEACQVRIDAEIGETAEG